MVKSKSLTHRQIADRLEETRLENGWSFRELGEQIGIALQKPPVPEPTVRKFIQRAGDSNFHDTTVYPLRKYVDGLVEAEAVGK